MSPRPSLRKRILSICGPALGVVLAYNFAIYGPLQRHLKAERTKLHKLEVAGARRSNSLWIAEKLSHAEAAIQSMNEQIGDAKETGCQLVSRRADLRKEFLQSFSPAIVMAETLSLLSQYGLECIDSSPVAVQVQSAPIAESLKPVAVLLGEAGSEDANSFGRREIRLTLRGRFKDMQSALREIQAAPLGIFTVSLEMDDSDVNTDIRIWILTIAV